MLLTIEPLVERCLLLVEVVCMFGVYNLNVVWFEEVTV